ncbi:MAG: DUF2530 domain-containing protein [Mycobacteriales bacterium]
MSPARRPDPPPLPTRDVLTVTVGTLVWLVALGILLPLHARLAREGHLWWLATAAVGSGLGLAGIAFLRWRQRRLGGSSRSSSASSAAGS